jgi:hypothetical protein
VIIPFLSSLSSSSSRFIVMMALCSRATCCPMTSSNGSVVDPGNDRFGGRCVKCLFPRSTVVMAIAPANAKCRRSCAHNGHDDRRRRRRPASLRSSKEKERLMFLLLGKSTTTTVGLHVVADIYQVGCSNKSLLLLYPWRIFI